MLIHSLSPCPAYPLPISRRIYTCTLYSTRVLVGAHVRCSCVQRTASPSLPLTLSQSFVKTPQNFYYDCMTLLEMTSRSEKSVRHGTRRRDWFVCDISIRRESVERGILYHLRSSSLSLLFFSFSSFWCARDLIWHSHFSSFLFCRLTLPSSQPHTKSSHAMPRPSRKSETRSI